MKLSLIRNLMNGFHPRHSSFSSQKTLMEDLKGLQNSKRKKQRSLPVTMSTSKNCVAQSVNSKQNDGDGWGNAYFKFGVPCFAAFGGLAMYDQEENSKPEEVQGSLKTKVHNIVEKKFLQESLPGVSYMVLIDGKVAASGGLGYSDIENRVPCTSSSVMRIASISKSITMAATAKLVEEGKLDIDAPVQKYVSSFPTKKYDGKDVTITTRHLLSHTSGIRHYELKHDKSEKKGVEMERDSLGGSYSEIAKRKKMHLQKFLNELSSVDEEDGSDEFNLGEVYIKEKFGSIKEAIQLFKDDELLFEPGTRFGYTTHGWTLVGAVIESASKESFSSLMKGTFKELNMNETYLESYDSILYNRSRQYTRAENGGLKNAPYVDNSYKYAGGGIVSNCKDLAMFGMQMLCSAQNCKGSFLSQKTMEKLWTPYPGGNLRSTYGPKTALGWFVDQSKEDKPFIASHTGAAVGGSSILCIADEQKSNCSNQTTPKGIVVVLLTNIDNISFRDTAMSIIRSVSLHQKAESDGEYSPAMYLSIQFETLTNL